MTRDALRFQEPAISGGSSVGRRHRRQPFIQGMQPFAAFRSGTRGKRGRRIGNAVLFLSRWSKRTRGTRLRSEEHTSELQSLMRISYAVFCLKTKNKVNAGLHKKYHD